MASKQQQQSAAKKKSYGYGCGVVAQNSSPIKRHLKYLAPEKETWADRTIP
jgi:hypothetical protein